VGKTDSTDSIVRGNVFRNCDLLGTYSANEVEHFDSEFYNCTVGGKHADKTKESVLRLVNCYLVDSRLNHQGVFTNDTTSARTKQKAVLDQCRIIFTEAFGNNAFYTFYENKTENIALNRRYVLHIERSTVELRSDQIQVTLVKNFYNPQAAVHVSVLDSVIRAQDPAALKFFQDIALNSVTVDGCTYEGFDELVLPVNAYAVVDRKYAAEPARGTFRAGDVVYKSQPLPGDYVGWVCIASGIAAGTPWAPLTAYTVGSSVYAGNNVYRCVAAGTSGSSEPTHTSGTAPDGTVTWEYVGPRAQFKAFGAIAL
jgi:hypothetical protein